MGSVDIPLSDVMARANDVWKLEKVQRGSLHMEVTMLTVITNRLRTDSEAFASEAACGSFVTYQPGPKCRLRLSTESYVLGNHHAATPQRPAGVTQSSRRTPSETRGRDAIITRVGGWQVHAYDPEKEFMTAEQLRVVQEVDRAWKDKRKQAKEAKAYSRQEEKATQTQSRPGTGAE
eukprot:9483439-Pyramimonas_sp.AAC.2